MHRDHVCPECQALEAEEAKLVGSVVEAIRRQVPDVDAVSAELHVITALEDFRGARVRDYLPVLLERAALARLTP